MPYDGPVYTGEDVQKEAEDYDLKGKVEEKTLEKADRLQWVYSSFSDPGADWCRADFYQGDTKLQSVTVAGY